MYRQLIARGEKWLALKMPATLRASSVEAVTVPLWPDAGRILGLKRGQAYASAVSGAIPTIRFGKLYRVSKGWLDKVARGDFTSAA